MNSIWIPNEFIGWNIWYESSTPIEQDILNRAYIIWNHAAKLIACKKDEFSLCDGIFNLKKCIEQRSKAIETIYNFKKIDLDVKTKGYFELLETYEVARPFLIKNLFEIRNDIAHQDTAPPSPERCRELLDITWYYLKSTDYLLKAQKTDFFFAPTYDSTYAIHFSVDYQNHKRMHLSGWLPPDKIFSGSGSERLQIIVESIVGIENSDTSLNRDSPDSDICFRGYFETDKIYYPQIIRACVSSH